MARTQMLRIRNSSNPASPLQHRDSLTKYPLTPSGLNHRLSLGLRHSGVKFNGVPDVIFPCGDVPHWRVIRRIRVYPTLSHTEHLTGLVSNEIPDGFK